MYRQLVIATLVGTLATSAYAQSTPVTQETKAATQEQEKAATCKESKDACAAKALLETLLNLEIELAKAPEDPKPVNSQVEVGEDAGVRWILGRPAINSTRQVGNINVFLYRADDIVRRTKKDTDCDNEDNRKLCAGLDDLVTLITHLLEQREVGWSMAAILRLGLMVGDTGDGDSQYFARSESVSKAFGAYYVDFELPHWGDTFNVFDVAVAGNFGYAPVEALVRKKAQPAPSNTTPATTTVTPPEKMTALYMPGFTWGAAVRPSWFFARHSKSELSLVLQTGADRLSDLATKLGPDDNAAIGEVIRNDVGRCAWRHGAGLEYRYFGADMNFVHHDASRLLTPRLSLGVNYQYDERFKTQEDLKDFGNPWRWIARISVNVVEWVRDTAKLAESNDKYTVRVVFETDYPFRGKRPRVPSGNRLYIEGNVDMLKAFGFGEAKAATAGKATTNDSAPGGQKPKDGTTQPDAGEKEEVKKSGLS